MTKFYMIEQNQTDARYQIKDGDICQTLTARCGTGGGHVPMVIFTEDTEEGVMFYNDRRHADYHQAEDYAPAVTAKYGTGGATRR